jgi:hypothetical protein
MFFQGAFFLKILALCMVSIQERVVMVRVWYLFSGSSMSRVFLLRQLWIVNYYIKSSSNNLSNENIKTGVFPEKLYFKMIHFGILIHVSS